MSKIILKKNGIDYLFGLIPLHYPADRVYLDGDTTKSVQDKCARKSDLTNLDLTGTTNTTGSTIPSGTFFYLNGTLVRAKTAIASGATFTENTNYEVLPQGLAQRISNLEGVRYGANSMVNISSYNSESNYYTTPSEGYVRVETAGDAAIIVGGATLLEAGGKAVSCYVHKEAMIYGKNGSSNASSMRFIPLRI